MIRKTITYIDYNGLERTEDFYFHFSQAELAEMNLRNGGGLVDMINRVIKANDPNTLISIFKDLVLRAYGEKTADGKHFLKFDKEGNPLSRQFEQTEAYSKLFMELATDADAAANFVNAIMPAA